jgi:hypothetical protein
MTVTWDDETDAVLAGDLTAALGYKTPAGGTVVMPVAPIGLHDRAAGSAGFTTSLGFSKKLERIRLDPHVALAFHAREHGFGDSARYVLVQGRARVVEQPTDAQRAQVRQLAEKYLGSAREGFFWDRWLREYYAVRVPVHVEIERITSWPELQASGPAAVIGAPLPDAAPPPQEPPKNGTEPRVDVERAAKRLRATPHTLLGYVAPDGYPVVVPVEIEGAGPGGLALTSAVELPPGGRRAGLLGHGYRPKLIGLEARQHTGWLDVGKDGGSLYAPHTETGFKAPANKTLLLFLNGLLAKRGVRKAHAQRAG